MCIRDSRRGDDRQRRRGCDPGRGREPAVCLFLPFYFIQIFLEQTKDIHPQSFPYSPYNTTLVIHTKTLAINLEASLFISPEVLFIDVYKRQTHIDPDLTDYPLLGVRQLKRKILFIERIEIMADRREYMSP